MDRRSQKDRDVSGAIDTNDEIKDSTKPSTDTENASTITVPTWSDTIWKWGQGALNTASSLQQQAAGALRTALGQPPPAPPSEHSRDVTSDSQTSWVMLYPHRDLGEGYKQYLDEQDAKAYVEVDEKEAESGVDDDEEDDLGGEKWNTKL